MGNRNKIGFQLPHESKSDRKIKTKVERDLLWEEICNKVVNIENFLLTTKYARMRKEEKIQVMLDYKMTIEVQKRLGFTGPAVSEYSTYDNYEPANE